MEFPHLEALHAGLDGGEVRILIVDVKNMEERTAELVSEYNLTLPVLLDDEDVSHEVYGVVYTPTTFVIDRHGRAVFRHVGFAEGQETMLEKEIALLLEKD